jgi:prolycopene isomerase
MITRRKSLEIISFLAGLAIIGWTPAPGLAKSVSKGRKDGEYDAVIIGAGLGGLGCAALMARGGMKPLVIEQHSVPGGYASSFERVGADGSVFPCEVSLHSTSARAPDMRRMLTDMGVYDRLDLVDHKLIWSSVEPGGIVDVPPCGVGGFCDMVGRRFPGEREGLGRLAAYWQKLLDEVAAYDSNEAAALKLLFPLRHPTMWDVAGKTLAQVLDRFVSDPAARGMIGMNWGYYGLPPSRLSAFYYLLPFGEYLTQGGQYLRGTSQTLSDALADVVVKGGGTLLLNERVEAILMEDGRARGVRTASGKTFKAAAVVSNAAAPATFAMLPPGTLPNDYATRVAGLRPSMGTVMVWLGLDRDISTLQPRAGLSLPPSVDADAAYAAALAGDYERSGMACMIYDNIAPGFSPKGRTSLVLLTLCGYEPWSKYAADYAAGRKDAYERAKRDAADRLIAQAEARILPGLSKMIVMREAATPLTNQRFTGNTGGAIYGFDQSVDNSYMTRLPNKTPVPGLLLSSAWGNPGGGFAGALMAGKGAFKLLVEERG